MQARVLGDMTFGLVLAVLGAGHARIREPSICMGFFVVGEQREGVAVGAGLRAADSAGGGRLVGAAKSAWIARMIEARIPDARSPGPSGPAEFPPSDEYVTKGAAMQAAAALTGSFPSWQVAVAELPAAPLEAQIVEQHAAAKTMLGYDEAKSHQLAG